MQISKYIPGYFSIITLEDPIVKQIQLYCWNAPDGISHFLALDFSSRTGIMQPASKIFRRRFSLGGEDILEKEERFRPGSDTQPAAPAGRAHHAGPAD